MSEEKNIQIFFVGALITSVVGAILLFFTDFAGWLEGGYDYYVHTGVLFAGPAPIFIILMAAALLLTGGYSAWSLATKAAVDEKQLKLVLLINIGVCAVSVLLTISLWIWFTVLDVEWWLDAGFFGSLIGGILTALFFKLALDNLKR